MQDLQGHGTHVATTIAGALNSRGIVGVAPDATIVGLKACTVAGFCFIDSVAAALRYAGDHQIDVVNLSLFADPYLYYCSNDAGQRAMYKQMKDAAKYAQQRGVVIVAAAGNEADDLGHPVTDDISPDWPPDTAETRRIRNNCRVAPAELPGVLTVSASGVTTLASYSNVGNPIDVTAPGGDAAQTPGTTFGRILAGWSRTDEIGPMGSIRCRRPSRRGRRRQPVGLDQRHLDGLAPRGWRRGADPGEPSWPDAGIGDGERQVDGDADGLPEPG